MKLTNQEIAKVFVMYLGTEHYYRYVDYEPGQNAYGGILNIERLHRLFNDNSICEMFLKLTPLSEISDEDAVEVAKIEGFEDEDIKDPKIWPDMKHQLYLVIEGALLLSHYSIMFLISRNYAVPLWLGVNHECNGKTAIELGIALPSPTTAQISTQNQKQ